MVDGRSAWADHGQPCSACWACIHGGHSSSSLTCMHRRRTVVGGEDPSDDFSKFRFSSRSMLSLTNHNFLSFIPLLFTHKINKILQNL
jgi:hypothetical protein